jgi:hypothetical protein
VAFRQSLSSPVLTCKCESFSIAFVFALEYGQQVSARTGKLADEFKK